MKGLQIALCILALFILSVVNPLEIKSLEGVWELNDKDGEYTKLSAKVPGGIYTDLMNNLILSDVFYQYNDVESRWAAKKTWLYSRQFEVDEALLNHKQINIVFDGVDTFADVYINNVIIGNTANMFVRYDFDIKESLKLGTNNITLEFQSPIRVAQELFDIQNQSHPVGPICLPDHYHGECHSNHIRKMQASFSWDWGPAFPSVGIWKNVYLEAFDHTVIRDVTVTTTEEDSNWRFLVTIYYAINNEKQLKGTLNISTITEFEVRQNIFDLVLMGKEEFTETYSFNVPKDRFKLWWPNGMGEQPLYTMILTYTNNDNTEESSMSLRIGLRTVELVQNELEHARDFYFKINGIPMFAKGTNSIPIHILPELSQNETQIRFLLQSSKDVHMNMVRVWGGGVYESDMYYEIADELGILVWQDLMFACAMYPTNEDFLNNVKKEIKHQARRLQHHASLVLWSGNNENEAALVQNWFGTWANFSLYKNDYVKLYIDTIKPIILEIDESRSYVTSSPSNGIKTEMEGFVSWNPIDPLYGDIHYYNYLFDAWNQNLLMTPRFASEYGFQSLPSVKTMLSATNNKDDLSINGEFMLHRQHHLNGYTELKRLIRNRLNMPDDMNNFDEAFIFYSQIFQAMAIKIQTEHYRQWYSKLNSIGWGHTMGALYWQLNDVWVAPSWAGIDFQNRWKMQHYYAKEFFAPIIVSAHISKEHNVDVHIVSDSVQPIFNATLILTTYKWDSFDIVDTIEKQVDIKTGSKIVHSFVTDEYYNTIDCGDENLVNQNCLTFMSLKNQDDTISPVNTVLPLPIKDTSIQNATVEISNVIQQSDKKFVVEISTDAIAAFVWLDCDVAGQFYENGFFQYTKQKQVEFTASAATTLEDLKKSLSVTHLLDSYYF